MFGSTLWVEQRLAARAPPMAAFLYVDSSVRALDFMADVSPGLRESLDEVLGHVADPGQLFQGVAAGAFQNGGALRVRSGRAHLGRDEMQGDHARGDGRDHGGAESFHAGGNR